MIPQLCTLQGRFHFQLLTSYISQYLQLSFQYYLITTFYSANMTEAENLSVYSKCNNVHGHNYIGAYS